MSNKFSHRLFLRIFVVFILSVSSWGLFAFAAPDTSIKSVVYEIKAEEIKKAKGLSFGTNKELEVYFPAAALAKSTKVELTSLTEPIAGLAGWEMVSPVYQIDIRDDKSYPRRQPLTVKLSYSVKNDYLKQVFFFDKQNKIWKPLSTTDYPDNHFVRAQLQMPFARLAVFAQDNILSIGDASWYKYKNGMFAASPDYAKGTKLLVTNLQNGKSVEVLVNDFGPDRKIHPGRVVDLDKKAFAKIASLGAGIIKVKVEPKKAVNAKTVNSTSTGKPQIAEEGLKEEPLVSTSSIPVNSSISVTEIKASSAIAIWEDGKTVFNKNSEKVSPLASLSKLVAINVFLSSRPDLNRKVVYKVQDENYNYQYCEKWESARITLKEGDQITLQDLIYSALVGSANNAIESLVRESGMDRTEFISNMNKVVKKWGAKHTNFVEPTGLSPENVSSPEDYAIITKEVYKNPLLKKISTAKSYSFTTINTKIKHTVRNTNKLILPGSYLIEGAKTGYLEEAGYCLMNRIKVGSRYLITVVFGAPSRQASLDDTLSLFNYALKAGH